MSININITFTFMHISRLILASKSTPFTFFIWIFTYIITFLHGRFVYVHTFFHYKMMCGCRLITCLYDIRQTSYERRLHHSRVAPSEPIWAEFAHILGNICPQLILAATDNAEPYRLYIHISDCIYYGAGKIKCCSRIRIHEKKSESIVRPEKINIKKYVHTRMFAKLIYTLTY